VSVPLQSVPDNDRSTEADEHDPVAQAKHEAAEIVARAHRQAETIVAEAHGSTTKPVPNPLAALGNNAEEIIGQVRKLIAKQRQLQADNEELKVEIDALKAERDELVQRLTDAVERMEELAAIADAAQTRAPMPRAQTPPPPMPPPAYDPSREDTSLAARLRQAEAAEAAQAAADESPLAARLEQAERDREDDRPAVTQTDAYLEREAAPEPAAMIVDNDGRSFYDRHSAKLPRLEGDGGRSVLSAMGGMRPELDTKGRKGRRRNKK
jgi:hypothetical protein